MDFTPATVALIQAISQRTGKPCQLTNEATGGCISRSMVMQCGNCKVFVKLNDASQFIMFQAEADGLNALDRAGQFRVPRPVALGCAAGVAFLAMEFLELRPLQDRDDGVVFGHALAEMHQSQSADFGWRGPHGSTNFLGANPQSNQPTGNWPHFFAQHRLLPQVQLLEGGDTPAELIDGAYRLVEGCAALLSGHQTVPSLVHGDLWHGNAAMADGRPTVFDPAVHYADREVDLAMSELFGGFPDAFYAAYREAWPLPAGQEQRKLLYNLYHVLNHVNLYGRSYHSQARRMMGRLLAELKA